MRSQHIRLFTGQKRLPQSNRSVNKTRRQFFGRAHRKQEFRLLGHWKSNGAYGQKRRYARNDTAICFKQQGLHWRSKYHYGLLHSIRRVRSCIYGRHGRPSSPVRTCGKPVGKGRQRIYCVNYRYGFGRDTLHLLHGYS